MTLRPIQVECYAGHRGDQTPRRFLQNDTWVEVEEVVDQWYQVENLPGWPRAEYFRVSDTDQRSYLLKHDQEADGWFLVQP